MYGVLIPLFGVPCRSGPSCYECNPRNGLPFLLLCYYHLLGSASRVALECFDDEVILEGRLVVLRCCFQIRTYKGPGPMLAKELAGEECRGGSSCFPSHLIYDCDITVAPHCHHLIPTTTRHVDLQEATHSTSLQRGSVMGNEGGVVPWSIFAPMKELIFMRIGECLGAWRKPRGLYGFYSSRYLAVFFFVLMTESRTRYSFLLYANMSTNVPVMQSRWYL
ncbi:hypothetical protein B0H34DRAFT_62717 [Crassisporium funariophilum]|nr:hypothetical protein B0H34DRAFT_62717 [Crassisporium funariophilum]